MSEVSDSKRWEWLQTIADGLKKITQNRPNVEIVFVGVTFKNVTIDDHTEELTLELHQAIDAIVNEIFIWENMTINENTTVEVDIM